MMQTCCPSVPRAAAKPLGDPGPSECTRQLIKHTHDTHPVALGLGALSLTALYSSKCAVNAACTSVCKLYTKTFEEMTLFYSNNEKRWGAFLGSPAQKHRV